MEPTEKAAFFDGLNALGAFFSDDLSEIRLRLYWEAMRDKCTLEEWYYACAQTISRETFHKVPLPAALMDYVRELREQRKEEQHRQRRMQEEEQRLRADQERQRLLDDPAWQAQRERDFQDAKASLDTIFGANWRTTADMQRAIERSDRDQRLRRALLREERGADEDGWPVERKG